MTLFVVVCASMALIAIALVVRPLLRKSDRETGSARSSKLGAAVVAIAIPAVAAGLYVSLSHWNWQQQAQGAAQQATIEEMVAKLERRLQETPDDLKGWLMLGRSYMALEKPQAAVKAYQKAYDLGGDANIEAVLGLGEALVITDENSLRGRAGELFEAVLKRQPANPTALWYGSVSALANGNLQLAKQRVTTILSLNPPQQVRDILERQLQDIDQQLGVSAPQSQAAADAKPQRVLTVKVTLAPKLKGQVDERTPLFVLARDGAGPPLAAVRRAVGDLPLTIALSDRDAMIAGRSIATVQQVEVVARISKTGTPQQQSGDLFGQVQHRFASPKSDTVEIVIDRVVP